MSKSNSNEQSTKKPGKNLESLEPMILMCPPKGFHVFRI